MHLSILQHLRQSRCPLDILQIKYDLNCFRQVAVKTHDNQLYIDLLYIIGPKYIIFIDVTTANYLSFGGSFFLRLWWYL